MKRMFRTLILLPFMTVLVLVSDVCANDLSLVDAAELIKKEVRPLYDICGGKEESRTCEMSSVAVRNDELAYLEKQGLIKIVSPSYEMVRFELTEASNPYIRRMKRRDGGISLVIITGSVRSVDVTEVTKPSNGKCDARFEVSYNPTPFLALKKARERMLQRGLASFTLDDDGWRLEHIRWY
jgi:hypothetical protein